MTAADTAVLAGAPPRQPEPKPPTPGVLAALTLSVAVTAATWAVALATVRAASGGWKATFVATAVVAALGVLALFIPAVDALRASRRSASSAANDDVAQARLHAARARESVRTTYGWSFAAGVLVLSALFVLANDHAVQQTFLQGELMGTSFADITRAFGVNLFIAAAAQAFVLVWGLILAIARLTPGRAGRPIRALAITYIDIVRAVPAIIVIYLIGFGLPLANVPVLSSLSPSWYAILALAVVYGAYVAEVFRSGIESIHPSQVAAARSLGLSYGQTLRSVVVPQAVRRVVPPLLNDFIGLQKDTALVNVIGTIDAFNQAKIFSANHFNLSSVTVVAALFIVITIPQARLVDRMIAREQRRTQAGRA